MAFGRFLQFYILLGGEVVRKGSQEDASNIAICFIGLKFFRFSFEKDDMLVHPANNILTFALNIDVDITYIPFKNF